jgi:hypothetical protein
MDYTFNAVNQQTIHLTPFSAMQFGSALHCGIPLSLPMGWNLSPPFFCAFTETCTDLTNNAFISHPCHPFHDAARPQIVAPSHTTFAPDVILPYNLAPPMHPLTHADVYMDDFLLASQQPRQTSLMNTLLHHLNTVFVDPAESPRRLIVSALKVTKGDATYSTSNCILGWEVDTHHMTLQLPLHRLQRLETLLTSFLNARCTTRRKWQRLLGELRSTVPSQPSIAPSTTFLSYSMY